MLKKRIEKLEKELDAGKEYVSVVIIENEDGTRRIEINGVPRELSDEELREEIARLEERHKVLIITVSPLLI